jgi:hypothetical protein
LGLVTLKANTPRGYRNRECLTASLVAWG